MCDLTELLDHFSGDVMHGLHAVELVGFRKEIAFEGGRSRSNIRDELCIGVVSFQEICRGSKAGGLDGACDVEHGETLGHDHRVEVDVPAPKAFLDVDGVRRLVEQIFPRLQRAAMTNVAPEDERFLTANHSGVLEFVGDAARRVAGMQHYRGLPGRRDGNEKSPGKPACDSEDHNKDEPDDLAHYGHSLDDDRRTTELTLVRLQLSGSGLAGC